MVLDNLLIGVRREVFVCGEIEIGVFLWDGLYYSCVGGVGGGILKYGRRFLLVF